MRLEKKKEIVGRRSQGKIRRKDQRGPSGGGEPFHTVALSEIKARKKRKKKGQRGKGGGPTPEKKDVAQTSSLISVVRGVGGACKNGCMEGGTVEASRTSNFHWRAISIERQKKRPEKTKKRWGSQKEKRPGRAAITKGKGFFFVF